MILMREIQKICPGKWEELEGIEKEWQALEKGAGYPEGKRRYKGLSAPHDLDTLVVEVEWESFTVYEEVCAKVAQQPGFAELVARTDPLIESMSFEFYTVLP
jgi:hypothetical protein